MCTGLTATPLQAWGEEEAPVEVRAAAMDRVQVRDTAPEEAADREEVEGGSEPCFHGRRPGE